MNQREISYHRKQIIRDLLARDIRQVDIAKIMRTTPNSIGVVVGRIRAKDDADGNDAPRTAATEMRYAGYHDPNDPD